MASRPSPLSATPLTLPEWPLRVRSSRPLSTSHTFRVLSSDAEMASRPSPLSATPLTLPEWPLKVRSSRPLSTSHAFSVLSSDAQMASRPSPLSASPLTLPEWPLRVRIRAPTLHFPHLQGRVIRRRNSQPPVPTQRYSVDTARVALESAQFAPAQGPLWQSQR